MVRFGQSSILHLIHVGDSHLFPSPKSTSGYFGQQWMLACCSIAFLLFKLLLLCTVQISENVIPIKLHRSELKKYTMVQQATMHHGLNMAVQNSVCNAMCCSERAATSSDKPPWILIYPWFSLGYSMTSQAYQAPSLYGERELWSTAAVLGLESGD